MKKHDNKNIQELNTFNSPCIASSLVIVESESDLYDLIRSTDFTKNRFFVLGEGSSTLFNDSFDGVVIKDEIKGIEIISEDDEHVTVKVGSGECWREFVSSMAEKEYSGIENMAFIPGTIGAAVVQNLGAYGQVIEDVIVSVDVVDLYDSSKMTLSRDDCTFAYRHSVFKEDSMKSLYVVSVLVCLNKYSSFDTSYHSRYSNESLQTWLEKNAKEPYKPIDIVNAVTDLRRFKLPWIDEFGTCGSFFINPFVTKEEYEELTKKITDLQCYPVTKMDYSKNSVEEITGTELVKIPAGRLLDELGWKNKWIGNVGTFERHALCVVSNKKASSKEIRDYINLMKKDVFDNYGVQLKEEVVLVD